MKRSLLTSVILMLGIVCSGEETMSQLTERVFERAAAQLKRLDAKCPSDKIPYTFDNNKVEYKTLSGWTSGFFPGSLWYVYEYTKDEAFRQMAVKQTRKLSGIVGMKTHHDIGFQVNCSYGNAYRLTGEKYYFEVMNDAAAKLARRFSPVTGVIKSWDNKKWNYPVIIDNMMNLELLVSVGNKCNCDSLKAIACSHADNTIKNHFRPDYSSYHVLAYDAEKGGVEKKQTSQGFSDESCWSRGEAWALYGYSMMYRETGRKEYREQARSIAKYVIPLLPEDGIPEWDYNAPGTAHAFTMEAKGAPEPEKFLWKEDDSVFRDASAAAIMASAFVELSGFVKGKEKKLYRQTAEKIIRALASPEYLAETGTNGGFLLKHSAANVHGWSDVDNPQTYADYYFLEALLRFNNGN